MKYFFLLLVLLPFAGFGQVKCYSDASHFSSDLRYRIADDQLYFSAGTFREVEFFFLDATTVFFGRRGDRQYPVYSFTDKAIYKGGSSMASDLLYTLHENGVYLGNSTSSSDCLFFIEGGKLYRGKSTSVFDLLLSCDKAELTPEEKMLLIAAVLPY